MQELFRVGCAAVMLAARMKPFLFAALAVLPLAFLPLAARAAQSPPAATPPDLLEAPRIGLVCKGPAASVRARESWRAAFGAQVAAPELVDLDALPASVAKAKTPPPRWVIVFEEAKAVATSPTTEEYEDSLGKSSRIRWRGAVANGKARIYELREKPIEVSLLLDAIDETKPPDKARFAEGETKKEVVVDPEEVLDRMLLRMANRAVSLASAVDLWRERARVVELAAALEPEPRAAFWRRASAVTLDPWDAVPVPWASLEAAALALWKRAPDAAARFQRPATTCAWCDAAAPEGDAACACPESRALAGALAVLSDTMSRPDPDGARKSAIAIEVATKDLDPSRAKGWKPAVAALEKRIRAEQEADRKRLASRLSTSAERAWGKLTYVILVPTDRVEWKPSEPDLERHASELVQAFTIGSNTAGTYFGVDASRSTIALARWDTKTSWYEAVGRREFKGDGAVIDGLLLRALWDNARGVDSEPKR